MAKLKAADRNKLKDSDFALPKKRKYPVKEIKNGKIVDSPSHAANAKSRAAAQVNAGKMSKSTEAKIDAKANKVLGKSKVKKK